MFIAYNQGNEQPQRIRHNIKLGVNTQLHLMLI